MTSLDLPEHPRILVITLRRLGDVLLTTPLIRTLKRGLAGSSVTALVFRGTEGMLAGNPDVDEVLAASERPSLAQTAALVRRLWRGYDLAVSTQAGDRPTFLALMASRRRVGLVPRAGQTGAWWKRHAHHIPVVAEPDCHRVTQLLALASALGLEQAPDIVCPQGGAAEEFTPRMPYAVVHASPFYRYKRWTDDGWRGLARGLAERGLALVATEGRDPAEQAYIDGLWGPADPRVTRVRGRLDWASLSALLKGAAIFIGPDTSMTHLAAASGCPTIALFGPTSPRLIGPWPPGGLAEPWDHAGTIQRRANVWVVQNPLPCLPCEKLGCEGHLDSYSRCLDELPVRSVLSAVDQALGTASRSPALANPGSMHAT
ncbi:MAG TPA: glycosyltransferase family 9 protein [Xanthobacteraceae bacterium]|nr:glycosyltransferase family 9 protein [Xanthobacteraceae bacterium]